MHSEPCISALLFSNDCTSNSKNATASTEEMFLSNLSTHFETWQERRKKQNPDWAATRNVRPRKRKAPLNLKQIGEKGSLATETRQRKDTLTQVPSAPQSSQSKVYIRPHQVRLYSTSFLAYKKDNVFTCQRRSIPMLLCKCHGSSKVSFERISRWTCLMANDTY